jgi:3-hydroxybutyryl-CoA dehydrogenase
MVQTICICGAGTMGNGIAQVAAQHGLAVVLYDVNKDMINKAPGFIEKNLQTLATKDKIREAEKQSALDHIRYTNDLNDCIADVIIEAVVEKADVKVALFNQLAEINHSEVIFATNTSSLPVTAIAEKVVHPERVVGMHFFNPVPAMKLVEIIKTDYTNAAVITTMHALAGQLGKTPVLCKDAPGFIVNRVARPYYLEALRLLELGISDINTIDRLMEATGFKMGPFKLMDLIGNDVNYAVSTSVYEQLGQPGRLKPSPIQKEKVEQGKLGRKSGEGYYRYDKPPPRSDQ